jgi:hypothetical protein
MSETGPCTLLNELAASLHQPNVDATVVVSHLKAVLEFLVEPENDTDDNCRAVNTFVLLGLLEDDRVKQNLSRLPRFLVRIIEDMGMCLHDTHTAPSVAREFESTPQQLLARLTAEA